MYIVPFMQPSTNTRPSRNSVSKDKEWHRQYGRHIVSAAYHDEKHRDWLKETSIRKKFYLSDQWIYDEDAQTFLVDGDGNSKGRIRVQLNQIRGLVNRLKGNAIKMNFNASVKADSSKAMKRRDQALAERLFYSEAAQMAPSFKNYIQSRMSIGDSEAESFENFNSEYQDEFVRAMNALAKNVARKNKFKRHSSHLAEHLAYSGIGVKAYDIQAHEMKFRLVEPHNFFFDRSKTDRDLEDCEYMGEIRFLDLPTITESFDISKEDVEIIEDHMTACTNETYMANYGNLGNSSWWKSGKVPVFYTYYKDYEAQKYGYVRDQWGYILLAILDSDQNPGGAEYTESDLVPMDELSDIQRGYIGSKGVKTVRVANWRETVIIPSEYLHGNAQGSFRQDRKNDIVLRHGSLKYQRRRNASPFDSFPPYCVSAYLYVDGQLYTPIDDAINPQRLINRMMSLYEAQFNQMKPAFEAYDISALKDSGLDEAELNRIINEGGTVPLNGRGMGVNNLMHRYEPAAPRTMQYLGGFVEDLFSKTDRIIGENPSMRGQGNPEQLIGFTKLMIERGGITQEPYYEALRTILMSAYQAILDIGKVVYIENPSDIVDEIGENNYKVIEITKDYLAEDFSAFIEEQPSDEIMTQAADQLIFMLMTAGMLDQDTAAGLIGRSTADDVTAAARHFVSEQQKARQMQAEMEAQQAASQQGQIQEERQHEMNMKDQEHRNRMAEQEGEMYNQIAAVNARAQAKKVTE